MLQAWPWFQIGVLGVGSVGGTFVGTAAATAAFLAVAPFGAPAQAADKTLKVVVHADLKVLDPTWTATYITTRFSYTVYDTLFSYNSKYEPTPQMVDRWTISDDKLTWTFVLRDGLTFRPEDIISEARAAAPSSVVVPTSRTVAPKTTKLTVSDYTVTPTTISVAPVQSQVAGTDNGGGYVRFPLPSVTLTFPFEQVAYPQPVSVTPV